MNMVEKKLLFISGVARSGTTALANLINLHPKALVGVERYFREIQSETLTLSDFEKRAFLGDGPKAPERLRFYLGDQSLEKRYDDAVYVGDKHPGLFRHFKFFFEQFPSARHLYILRDPIDVVMSYEARKKRDPKRWPRGWREGLAEWNDSLRRVASLPIDKIGRCQILSYDTVFSDLNEVNRVFADLGLDPIAAEPFQPILEGYRYFAGRKTSCPKKIADAVEAGADWSSYKLLKRIAADQREARVG